MTPCSASDKRSLGSFGNPRAFGLPSLPLARRLCAPCPSPVRGAAPRSSAVRSNDRSVRRPWTVLAHRRARPTCPRCSLTSSMRRAFEKRLVSSSYRTNYVIEISFSAIGQSAAGRAVGHGPRGSSRSAPPAAPPATDQAAPPAAPPAGATTPSPSNKEIIAGCRSDARAKELRGAALRSAIGECVGAQNPKLAAQMRLQATR